VQSLIDPSNVLHNPSKGARVISPGELRLIDPFEKSRPLEALIRIDVRACERAIEFDSLRVCSS